MHLLLIYNTFVVLHHPESEQSPDASSLSDSLGDSSEGEDGYDTTYPNSSSESSGSSDEDNVVL